MCLRCYNQRQMKEIERHKWLESEKAGQDVGDEAALEWIKKHSANFRLEFGYLNKITRCKYKKTN